MQSQTAREREREKRNQLSSLPRLGETRCVIEWYGFIPYTRSYFNATSLKVITTESIRFHSSSGKIYVYYLISISLKLRKKRNYSTLSSYIQCSIGYHYSLSLSLSHSHFSLFISLSLSEIIAHFLPAFNAVSGTTILNCQLIVEINEQLSQRNSLNALCYRLNCMHCFFLQNWRLYV